MTPTSPGRARASVAVRAAAVAVMPDASGNGYWLVTATGNVYTFGDAPYFGAPGRGTVTSAVATPDGKGYWVLLSDGEVFAYGDAANLGSPSSANFNGLDAGDGHLRHLRRCGLLGLVGPRRRLQLRGRPQRRRHVGHPPQRVHHRGDRVLIRQAPSSPPAIGHAGGCRTFRQALSPIPNGNSLERKTGFEPRPSPWQGEGFRSL